MEKHFKKYRELRTEIDRLSEKLEETHKQHMKCKAGCDQCCMDYSILPIEFYSILNALKQENSLPKYRTVDDESECIFLTGHKCTIYLERPIICRTHGLPLLFMNEDGQWELSACGLNFTEFDMEEFTDENTFPQDKFNSRLFMLNKAFISAFSEKKYDEFELIPVKELINHL